MTRRQRALGLLTGRFGLLLDLVQWLQGFGGFAGGEALEFWRCCFQCSRGLPQLDFCGFGFLRTLTQIDPPLALRLGNPVLGLHVIQLFVEVSGLQLQFGALLSGQQRHPVGTCLELVEQMLGVARLFENPARDVTVDFGAGQFFEQIGSLVGAGIQEGCKTALGQKHGLGETLKVEARNFSDLA